MNCHFNKGSRLDCICVRGVAITLFLIWCLLIAHIFYTRLVPEVGNITRQDPHRLLTQMGPFTVEITGGDIPPDQTQVSQLQSQIDSALLELDDANSFPFIAKWMLKYDINISLKHSQIEGSEKKVLSYVSCNGVSATRDIIFSKKNISLKDFQLELKNSLPGILNSCAVNVQNADNSALPGKYVVDETYGFAIDPALSNYFILFLIVFLGSSAILPILRESVRFFKSGFSYFRE